MTRSRFSNFARREDGSMTALGLFLLIACFVIGGLALDVASAYMARTQLQATADATAHAALYVRDTNDEAVAVTAALEVAHRMMPTSEFGNFITSDDIVFGEWDAVNQVFTPDPGNDDAVWVDVQRAAARSNPVGTYFLNFTGIGSWNVRRGSVYETYRPTCFREGMVADEVVDVQSNNDFVAGFCIHSNEYVSMNVDNNFEYGTIVSMPDKRDLDTPTDGFTKNPGLSTALRDGAYQIRILNLLPEIFADLRVAGSKWTPAYITHSTIKTLSLSGGPKTMSNFSEGYVHVINCSGSQRLQLAANALLKNFVLVTNCEVFIVELDQRQPCTAWPE